jgi:hypothetical protein
MRGSPGPGGHSAGSAERAVSTVAKVSTRISAIKAPAMPKPAMRKSLMVR